MMKYLTIALILGAGAAHAELSLQNTRYVCERGVEVPVAYVSDADHSVVVLNVEGGQYALEREESASGTRYGWPSDGSNYVWWTKDTGAMLIWKNGETGEEVTLLAECVQQ